jgi:fructokinase
MIVSCGEALVDLVPEPVAGGGPMNVSIAAARLGVPAAFVGGISTDEFGDLLWRHLASNGVDLTLCPRLDAPTAKAIVEHVPELRFRFEGAGTADTLLAEADLNRLGPGPHIVHGGTLGMFRGTTAETLAGLVESHDGIVSLDCNVRPQIIDDPARWQHFHDRWLAHTDIYKGSNEDFDWIWPGRSMESCADQLISNGTEAVVLTRGSDGLSIVTAGGEVRAPAPSITVVDTVGAGDTIVGALLSSVWNHGDGAGTSRLGEIDQADWLAFGERAVRAAAITCSRPGADPPYSSELVDWHG